jgi:hypothetical protein
MQVLFISRHPVPHELRELALRRVRFAMCRMTWMVARASVQFSDTNGPRGGIDKRCQIQLRTGRGGPVVVTSVARDWREALDGALARAKRTLLRLWRRGGDARKGHVRAIAHDA